MTAGPGTPVRALSLRRGPLEAAPGDHVVLSYEARLLRRRRLTTASGLAVLADLPEVVSLDEGDALVLTDGRLVGVRAAEEALVEVRGDLPRLAWHIGNRHTPCEIGEDRLVIRQDHVLEGMLTGLGAELVRLAGPFRPEGGAYGHGRTMGHSHGPAEGHGGAGAHGHDHAQGHSHAHVHIHDHGPDHRHSHDAEH